MRRTLILACFLVLIAAAFRREAASQSNLIRQIAPGVYFREAEPDKNIIANTGWVVFRDYVLVIDANFPWGAKAILPDIKKTTDKPIRFVFNTHYHGDHAFGNSVWIDAGATIICSEECTAESKSKNVGSWSGDRLKDYRLEHPQVSFQDHMSLCDGNQHVDFIRIGPAHTKGDSAAWLPKDRILFTGDVVVNKAGNNMADKDADPEGWLRALDALSKLDLVVMVPGHGAPGHALTIKGQRAYIAAIIDGVRAGIKGGKSADEIAKTLDLSAHKPWGDNAQSNATSIKAVYAKLK